MKKFTALLMLICIALLPLVSQAETIPAVTWEESGAALIEALGLEGDFVALPEMGLQFWLPSQLVYVESSEEDLAKGIYATFVDSDLECVLQVTALHQDGATLDDVYAAAVANGLDTDYVILNGLYTVSYKDAANDVGCVTLVDTNSNIITFSITPINSDLAEAAFAIIMTSLMPQQ